MKFVASHGLEGVTQWCPRAVTARRELRPLFSHIDGSFFRCSFLVIPAVYLEIANLIAWTRREQDKLNARKRQPPELDDVSPGNNSE